MFIQTPNTSLFPEFDIASKINPDEGYEHNPFAEPNTLTDLLWPLSNASTLTIRAALRGKQLFARFSDREYEGARRVVLSLQDNGRRLSRVIPPTAVRDEKEPVQTETEVDDQGSSVYDEEFGPGPTILSPLRFQEFEAEPYRADAMREEFRETSLTPPPELSSRYS
jgi:hypothetical protein